MKHIITTIIANFSLTSSTSEAFVLTAVLRRLAEQYAQFFDPRTTPGICFNTRNGVLWTQLSRDTVMLVADTKEEIYDITDQLQIDRNEIIIIINDVEKIIPVSVYMRKALLCPQVQEDKNFFVGFFDFDNGTRCVVGALGAAVVGKLLAEGKSFEEIDEAIAKESVFQRNFSLAYAAKVLPISFGLAVAIKNAHEKHKQTILQIAESIENDELKY